MVEGGHASHEQDRTRWENRRSRHATRQLLSTMTHDLELFESAVLPISEPAYMYDDPHDHGAHAQHRWLAAHVGEEWGAAMSRLVQMRRMQSAYGSHLLRSYVTSQVDSILERFADFGFHYDEHGILHDAERRWPRSRACPQRVGDVEFAHWLGSRKIGRRGTRLYWFVVADTFRVVGYWTMDWVSDAIPLCGRGHTSSWRRVKKETVPYRQDCELAADEYVFFDRLTPCQQVYAMNELRIDPEIKAA